MAKIAKFRRPSESETEKTVVTGTGGGLISWTLPKGDKFEMLSPDDLLSKRGFRVYREMRADDQVKACLWFKKMLVAGRAWEITVRDKSEDKKKLGPDKKKPVEAKPKTEFGKTDFGGFGSGPDANTPVPKPIGVQPAAPVQKHPNAEWIEQQLQRLNMKQIIWEMLTAFDFGASFGELIFEINDEMKYTLKDVAFRDPEFMHILTDIHGNISIFQQQPNIGVSMQKIDIKPEKVLHYAYQSEFRNHWGISDLRAAYRAWWSKKYVTQFYNVFLERFGAPLMMMKYPPGSTPELKNALKGIMSSLSSKTDILVPEGVSVELIEATRAGTAKFDEALVLHDNAVAHAILMPALLGASNVASRGSDSQSRLHLKTLMKMIQFICEQIEFEITKKIVLPMQEKNFNEEAEICFKFQDYGEFEAFEISDAIKELHNAGILSLDSTDTNYIRSIMGLALRGEENPDQVERPMLNQLPGMPGGNDQADGGGAKQSNSRAEKGASTKKTDSSGKPKKASAARITVNQPPVNVKVEPQNISITMPEIKFPDINMPKGEFTVNIPPATPAVVNVDVNMPEPKKRSFRVKRNGAETTMVEE